jgi:plastocyanin
MNAVQKACLLAACVAIGLFAFKHFFYGSTGSGDTFSGQGVGTIPDIVSVTLMPGGYVPREITIKTGQTISFATDSAYKQEHLPKIESRTTKKLQSAIPTGQTALRKDATLNITFADPGDFYYSNSFDPTHTGVVHIRNNEISK